MDTAPIGIYGCGGMGRDIVFILDALGADARQRLVGFIDDSACVEGVEPKSRIPCFPLADFSERFPTAEVLLGVGCPIARRGMAQRTEAAGLKIGDVRDPGTRIGSRVTIGPSAVICGGGFLTTDITIGRCVQVNLQSVIGHDSILGDFVTLAAHVVLCGGAIIEDDVWLGVGAKVLPGVRVGRGSIVGCGAIVARDLPGSVTAVGVPARVVRTHGT